MTASQQGEDEQAKRWNGTAGRAWVEAQPVLDRMFRPIEALLVAAAAEAGPGGRVLDVGCGTGGTTLAIARRLAPGGHATGIDISTPMIEAAQARAAQEGLPAAFVRADAQGHAFAPAAFDTVVSRFGVMFFADPVRAFANLRRAAGPEAALRFVAWRSPAENPFMTTAEQAAAPLLDLPPRRPDVPGQFAFADRARVQAILAESAWTAIDIQPADIPCTLPEADLTFYLSRLGPVGQALHDVDADTRARVIQTVRAAFEPFVRGAEVRFTAACWTVGARGGPA